MYKENYRVSVKFLNGFNSYTRDEELGEVTKKRRTKRKELIVMVCGTRPNGDIGCDLCNTYMGEEH